MRQGYKISLFFACIAVLVLIALILLKRHALYQSEEVPFIEEIQEEQDDITQVQNTDIRITCDQQEVPVQRIRQRPLPPCRQSA